MTSIDLDILEALADIKFKNETETDKFSREAIVELIGEVRKLRKVAEAAKILIDNCPNIYMETDGEHEAVEIALKEWKGE